MSSPANAPKGGRASGQGGEIGSIELPAELPGTRYRLDRLLGEGGAGEVYGGVHLELDKPVAIKVLLPALSQDPDYSARFRREAKAASRIAHPGVVTVTDFGSASDGRLFLVMELIEGKSLDQVVADGPLEPARALRITANLCDVLEAVHAAGIVHRDVKPSNIFLVGDDEVKLVDFGIARAGLMGGADWRITRTGRVCGTPGYMAPEHARNRETDARADVYSAGAVLYELLTGHPPYRGDSPVDVLMAQMSARLLPPSRAATRSRVPKTVDRLVSHMIAFEAKDRFSSAGLVAKKLRAAAETISPPAADGASRASAERATSGYRRWAHWAGLAAAALAVVAGAMVGLRGLPPVEPSPGEASETEGTLLSAPPEATVETAAVVEPSGPSDLVEAPDEPVSSAGDARSADEPGPSGAAGDDDGERVEPGRAGTGEPSVAEPGPERPARRPVADSRRPVRPSAAAAPPTASPPPAAREPAAAPDPEALLRRARVSAASGRAEEAERLYREALAAGAPRGAALTELGRLLLARGRPAEAVTWLQRAVVIRPGSAPLRIDLGRAYLGSGNQREAAAQWREVLERDPDHPRATQLLRSIGLEP